MNMTMYVPVCVTHARTHTHAHNNFIQQGIRDTCDSLLDPYNSMQTCHVLTHEIFTFSTGLLCEFLRFTNSS